MATLDNAAEAAPLFREADEVIATIEAHTAVDGTEPSPASTPRTLEWVRETLDKYQEQPVLLDTHLEAIVGPLMRAVRARTAEGDTPKMRELMHVVYILCKVRGYKTIVKFFPHQVADLEPAVALLRSATSSSAPGGWQLAYGVQLWLSVLMLLPFDLNIIDSTLASGAGADAPRGLIASVIELAKEQLSSTGPSRDAAAVLLGRLLTRPRMEAHLGAFIAWATELIGAPEGGDEGAGSAALARAQFERVGAYSALCACLRLGNRSELRASLSLLTPHLAPPEPRPSSTLCRKLAAKLAQRVALLMLPPRVAAWRYERGARSLLGNLQASGVAGAAPAGRCGVHATSSEAGGAEPPSEGAAPAGGASGDANGAARGAAAAANGGAAAAAEAGAAEEDEGAEVPEELEAAVEHMLCALADDDTVVRWSAAKGVGRIVARLPFDLGDEIVSSVLELFREAEEHSAWHGGCLALAELARRGLLLPARLAHAVPLVCAALAYDVQRAAHSVGQHVRDAAAYACWAFARAYAPAVMAAHVEALAPAMLVCACFDREVNCRRAAAAAFQEHVGRQGTFAHGIDIITVCDYHGVGSRARAYLTVGKFVGGFDEYARALLEHLWTVKAQHWDDGVRHLAARAAGVLCEREPQYASAVVIPELCKRALNADLRVRHGAALMLAELALALARLSAAPASAGAGADADADADADAELAHGALSGANVRALQGVVPAVEGARLYRGRGGEVMRAAACRVLQCCASARLPSTGRAQVKLIDSTVADCLRHPNEAISAAAAAALGAMAAAYLDTAAAARNARLGERFAAVLTGDDNAAATRGAALALSVLPRAQLLPCAARVVRALVRAAQLPEVVEQRDPETRRNAVRALAAVVATLRVAPPAGAGGAGAGAAGAADADAADTADAADAAEPPTPADADETAVARDGLDERLVGLVWGQLLACLRADYEVDKRGDVGSWVREAAMGALQTMAPMLVRAQDARAAVPGAEPVWTAFMAEELAAALVQQAHEKINRTRLRAARCLGTLLTRAQPALTLVPHAHELRAMFAPYAQAARAEADADADAGEEADGADADAAAEPADADAEGAGADAVGEVNTFAHTVGVLGLRPYARAALLGLLVSVGGLTESTVRGAGNALVAHLRSLDEDGLRAFVRMLHTELDAHADDERVLTPALRALEFLASAGALYALREGGGVAEAEGDGATEPPPSAPTDELALLVRRQAVGVREPRRLLASASAHVSLLPYTSLPVRRYMLRAALVSLAHKYPRVRRATANLLYEHVLTNEADLPADRPDEASALLAGTAWDGADADVRAARDELLRIYAFAPPAVRKAAPSKKPAGDVDAVFGTYTDLVRDTGY